jgi:hypothetical protein
MNTNTLNHFNKGTTHEIGKDRKGHRGERQPFKQQEKDQRRS